MKPDMEVVGATVRKGISGRAWLEPPELDKVADDREIDGSARSSRREKFAGG